MQLKHYRRKIVSARVPSSERVETGFSLVELMLVLLIFSVLMATAVALIRQANKGVQTRLSAAALNATGLAALGQMTREIRLAGFPSARSYTAEAVSDHPGIVATPFVTASDYDLVFEGDTDGNGQVELIEYALTSGSTTISRSTTPINSDGTLSASMKQTTILLGNVQNQLQGTPLFTWDVDASSVQPFPLNIRTVYIKAILKGGSNTINQRAGLTLMSSAQRLSP